MKGAITNSPIQLVPKPDGTFRLVTHFKALNRVTKPDRRYLINSRETIERLRDGKWSVPLAKVSQEKTAFTVNNKHYIYQRLPQGYLNSPVVFQAIMLEILKDLEVEIYIDDVLIVSNDEGEHVKTVKQVLRRLAEAGFKLNIKKTQLMTDMAEFLVFWISAGNRGVTQSMKDRVSQLGTPKTVREVQQTMG